ncbi:MAG: acyl-CoA dehydrogenase family protein [Thermodesulfobacteriota bacterium]
MSLPDRNNPYNFESFLAWRRNYDYYADEPFTQAVVRHYTGGIWPEVDAEARRLSKKVSYRWRDLAEAAALPEKRPYLMPYDGHKNRVDRLVRPYEVQVLEKEVFAEALFSARTHPWVRLAKMFLIYQNSEAGVACPLVCTEGLVAVLERYADRPETQRILEHCREGLDGDFGIGAQFLSEVQGGSDVPANLVEAVREGEAWRLYGNKFFCSAAHSDYAVVTAKPSGSEKVGLFVMPSWLPGDKERERRNGYTIDRLKWKMGTAELPTAEITLSGAWAYQVGPLERGLANVVGIVLTLSRLTVGLSGAAGMLRAWREAARYCGFREAFGLPLEKFPLAAGQLRKLETYAKRSTAGAFKLYREYLGLEGGLRGGLVTDEPPEVRRRRFNLRELIMLQKMTTAFDGPDVIRLAISLFGGHGVMEDFSALPRLYRDAAVNELWEGPRNVLLTQVYRDLQRVTDWYRPAEFVSSVLEGADPALIKELSAEIEELIAHGDLFTLDGRTLEVCRRWDEFCHRFYHAYQDLALAQVEARVADEYMNAA